MLHALLPFDAAVSGRGTLSVACRLLDPRHYRLTLLHVAVPAGASPPSGSLLIDPWLRRVEPPDAVPATTARVRRAFEHRFAAEVDSLASAGFTVALAVGFGRLADEIVEVAIVQGVDLVVLACTDPSDPERGPLGSLVEEVVRRGPAPVLLVRPDERCADEMLPLSEVDLVDAVGGSGGR